MRQDEPRKGLTIAAILMALLVAALIVGVMFFLLKNTPF
ncbi:putative membrane protein [Brucella pseudogrignonensis]|uniref:Putative membrane protein n=1 Tax=Brucella pseudogrignonensis TaxID=419475 RepID=A0A256GA05_9HYPH|nr:putative membrane protein [Brucella pseudogrignonensis]